MKTEKQNIQDVSKHSSNLIGSEFILNSDFFYCRRLVHED